jgi:hypothetical protein
MSKRIAPLLTNASLYSFQFLEEHIKQTTKPKNISYSTHQSYGKIFKATAQISRTPRMAYELFQGKIEMRREEND